MIGERGKAKGRGKANWGEGRLIGEGKLRFLLMYVQDVLLSLETKIWSLIYYEDYRGQLKVVDGAKTFFAARNR